MDVAVRIIELYDRIKFLEGELAYSYERIDEQNEEEERLEGVVKELTAKLVAERAVHKVNEQALKSCEGQLGMDDEPQDVKPDYSSMWDKGVYTSDSLPCDGCVYEISSCYGEVGSCSFDNQFKHFKEKE